MQRIKTLLLKQGFTFSTHKEVNLKKKNRGNIVMSTHKNIYCQEEISTDLKGNENMGREPQSF